MILCDRCHDIMALTITHLVHTVSVEVRTIGVRYWMIIMVVIMMIVMMIIVRVAVAIAIAIAAAM